MIDVESFMITNPESAITISCIKMKQVKLLSNGYTTVVEKKKINKIEHWNVYHLNYIPIKKRLTYICKSQIIIFLQSVLVTLL